MAQIPVNPPLIKAALQKGLRVAIFFLHDETIAEYHFIKDSRSLPGILENIICVMCTSTANDPLSLYGVSQSLTDFMSIFWRPVMYSRSLPYQRTDVRLYPGDWYPCFETDKPSRIAKIQEMLPELQILSEQIIVDDKKRLEMEQKRLEEEKKRREEEFKKSEEARKLRDDSRLRITANLLSRNIPSAGNIQSGNGIRRDTTSDADIASLLSGGFFGSL